MSSVSSTATASTRAYSLTNFLAMDTTIDIVPLFNYKSKMDFLISHDSVGPFYAGISTSVPLWIAVYLRRRNFCRLILPSWMSLDNLKAVLEMEVANKDKFSDYESLPFRYKEISRCILQACGVSRSHAHVSSSEEIPHVEQIRVLLEDISTTRMNKIRSNVHGFSTGNLRDTKPFILNVNGIGSAEMNAVKPFLENAFRDHLRFICAGTTTSQDVTRSEVVGDESMEENQERNVTVARSRIRRYGMDNRLYIMVNIYIFLNYTIDH